MQNVLPGRRGFLFYSLLLGQYRIILSADTASEVRQMPSQKRNNTGCCKVSAASGGNSEPKQRQRSQSARAFAPKHDAGTATRHYRAFWQRCRAAAAGAVLKPQGGIVRCCLSIFARHCDSITTSFALSSKNTDLIFPHYYKSKNKSSETAFASREWQSRIFQKTVHFKPWNAGYYAAILIA